MKEPEKKVIYYNDVTDDFAGNDIKTKEIGADFKYVNNNPAWKAAAFLLYYIFGVPFSWVCIRIINGTKIVNRKAIRKMKGGFFIYGNHTHWSDALLPYIVTAPKRTFMIANRDAISIKGIKNIVLMLGTIPIPSGIKQLGRFIETVEKRCGEGGCIAVYPEATTWPYYNGLRPFPPTSFTYPAKLHAPIIAMATTFHKRRGLLSFMKTPARTVNLSEPITAGSGMSVPEAKKFLHGKTYDFIKSTIEQNGSLEYIRYEKNTDAGVQV